MADIKAELRVAMVTMDLLPDDEDLPTGPCVILTGNVAALKDAARLMFQPVKIVLAEGGDA